MQNSNSSPQLRLASSDGQVPPWAGRTPRAWQVEALKVALDACRARERGVIYATMGSGKSLTLAEIAASGRGRVLVTTSTVRLVEQLAKTLEERCPSEVGKFYTHAKEAGCRITVACLPSVPDLLADPNWPGPPALWIADECHREGDAIRACAPAIAAPRALGFTATPYRADERDRLELWDREIYSYGVAEALRDGVIVPFRQIPWTGAEVELDEACLTMAGDAVKHGPGLANARSIDDAEMFAGRLCASGFVAKAVHSRQSRAEQAATMDTLRTGRLQVVVHVALLTEGVDYPWLRWLMMRRPVSSRVRFAQEVGRVLRSAPGKTEALLYDPHDLLGKLALSYEAVLGLVEEEEAEAVPFAEELAAIQEAVDEDDGDDGERAPLKALPAKRVEAWRRYLRALYLAAMGAGLVECRVKSTRWRPAEISDRQKEIISKKLGGLARDTRIPFEHRQALAQIGEHAEYLTKGDASDLLSLLFLFCDTRRDAASAKNWGQLTGAGG